MTDWIADAESGASIRAKLNSLPRTLASGVIATPLAGIIVPVPAEIVAVTVTWAAVGANTGEALAIIVSLDNGATWIYDPVDFFAWNITLEQMYKPDSGPTADYTIFYVSNSDSVGDVMSAQAADSLFTGTSVIDLGSAAHGCTIVSHGGGNNVGTLLGPSAGGPYLSRAMALSLTVGRVTHIQLVPYCQDDGDRLTSGAYSVVGTPA